MVNRLPSTHGVGSRSEGQMRTARLSDDTSSSPLPSITANPPPALLTPATALNRFSFSQPTRARRQNNGNG